VAAAGSKSVDALILSHGHLDHCGKIPVLTRAGYAGPIYCTPATAAVAHIVLSDAAKFRRKTRVFSISGRFRPISSRFGRSMSPPTVRWL